MKPKGNEKFDADSLRKIQSSEKSRLEKLMKRQISKWKQECNKKIALKIEEIPKILKVAAKQIAEIGGDNEAYVLGSSDSDLGVTYIGIQEGRDAVMIFPAVKSIITWAKKRNFGYKIKTCNGSWDLYLTW